MYPLAISDGPDARTGFQAADERGNIWQEATEPDAVQASLMLRYHHHIDQILLLGADFPH
jgi:hypothetical protein